METCVRSSSKRVAFWNNSNDLRIDKMNMSSIKKITHKTGKWKINRWCHHKSQKVIFLHSINLKNDTYVKVIEKAF